MHEAYQFGMEHGIKLMIGIELDQLQRRRYFLENRCFFCLSEVETVDHLFLHCAKTRVLWNLLFSLFGVSWILSCSVKETLLGWNGLFVDKVVKDTPRLGAARRHPLTPRLKVGDTPSRRRRLGAHLWQGATRSPDSPLARYAFSFSFSFSSPVAIGL
ncbi:hypothetical protein CK203_090049 [Vitis vinifera]|uniref:Reverse transcriptase zinc-binding domain-containing protein n=1 Tax=Vitis vinifera TaxID=29760 RepID=A0A438DY34_VITVI|nr:hypothetical protein CK203_090049 [Vitis vinifera]